MIQARYFLPALVCAALAACGGGGDSSGTSTSALNSTASTASSGSSTSGSSSSGSSTSGSSSSGSSSSSSSSSGGTSAAAQLAAKLGRPSRLLIGLGGTAESDVQAQGLTVDIFDRYLSDFDWTTWNSSTPSAAYVTLVAQQADALGAVPMFTLYQMAADGQDNMAALQESTFMTTYWTDARYLFQALGSYGKPALVNLEPDFWGFAEQNNSDPTQTAALVTTAAECASLPNNVAGVAQCLLAMARKYAPNAYVGFPPSGWGASSQSAVVSFMNALGAQNADFVTMQTLDRDAGCFEVSPQPSYCTRSGSDWYWSTTDFQNNLAQAQAYHTGIGGLPLIWWQTPMGVPSGTPGGTDYHYRDNREQYFLTNPGQLTAVGGLGVVFSAGETHQTNVDTDGGQFQTLSSEYLASPAALP